MDPVCRSTLSQQQQKHRAGEQASRRAGEQASSQTATQPTKSTTRKAHSHCSATHTAHHFDTTSSPSSPFIRIPLRDSTSPSPPFLFHLLLLSLVLLFLFVTTPFPRWRPPLHHALSFFSAPITTWIPKERQNQRPGPAGCLPATIRFDSTRFDSITCLSSSALRRKH